MIITPEQKDALAEWINIGFGRAASSLSELLGQRIHLKAPEVAALSLDELYSSLETVFTQELVMVHQNFSGAVYGDILLFLDFDSASILIDLLCGGEGQKRRLTGSDREALVEVGNILLNAYIGSFGDLLSTRINFSLPDLQFNTVAELPDMLSINQQELTCVLLVKTEFSLLAGNVTGYTVLVMEVNSLDVLIQSIQEFEGFEDDL